jgi:hypothetical protein
MPDWQSLIGDRLAELALEPNERVEVIEELGAHLDELFADLLRRGFAQEDAAQLCLDEVKDWRSLSRKIQNARRKENMISNRVTQLWLPGLLTFALSMGFLAVAQIFGPKPWILTWGHAQLFYIPWLFSLPFVGAAGAYLSHRAGGSRRAILFSIVFPVLPFLAAMLLVLPFSLLFNHFIAHNMIPLAILMALVGWVLGPGVALLVGGLPVQLVLSRRQSSSHIVAS